MRAAAAVSLQYRRSGVELGDPHLHPQAAAELAACGFELIVGSVHSLRRADGFGAQTVRHRVRSVEALVADDCRHGGDAALTGCGLDASSLDGAQAGGSDTYRDFADGRNSVTDGNIPAIAGTIYIW